ncbi:MAG: hypothetical protein E6G60_19640, partial [Actinobacteria bacterium]
TVLDAIVQEVDIPTGVVLFEWHSLGTIALAESYQQPPHGGKAYNYVHTNSIDVEPDDNLLVSGRDTFAWYKIDRVTGALIWRLGGKRSNFTIGRGAQTAWQHDVRSLGDGLFSAFDNGAVKGTITHRHTRGVVLRVDVPTTTEAARDEPRELPATAERELLHRLGQRTQVHRIQCRGQHRLRRQAADRRQAHVSQLIPRLPLRMARHPQRPTGRGRPPRYRHRPHEGVGELERCNRCRLVAGPRRHRT